MQRAYPPAEVIGTVFALAAFTVAVLSGLAAGRPAGAVLPFALVVLVVARVVGGVLGSLGEAAVREAIESHARAHPVPDVKRGVREATAESS